ncbi:hypothetical protein M1N56_06250 [Dehalococcoidia bacterium]|nr:hypothetical protein [Dehalococcoidia bacterium]
MVENSDETQDIDSELSFEQQEREEVESYFRESINEAAERLNISTTEVEEYLGEDLSELLAVAKSSEISGMSFDVDEQLFQMELQRIETDMPWAEESRQELRAILLQARTDIADRRRYIVKVRELIRKIQLRPNRRYSTSRSSPTMSVPAPPPNFGDLSTTADFITQRQEQDDSIGQVSQSNTSEGGLLEDALKRHFSQ